MWIMWKKPLFFATNNAISRELWMWEKDSERCRCRSKWHNHPNQELTLPVISNPVYSRQSSILAQRSCWGEGLNVHLCSLAARMQHKYRTHLHMRVKRVPAQWRNNSINCQHLIWRCFIAARILFTWRESVSTFFLRKETILVWNRLLPGHLPAHVETPTPNLNSRIIISNVT